MFSREYKVMLNPGTFTGVLDGPAGRIGHFGREFQQLVLRPRLLSTTGALGAKKSTRTVRFYDTSDDLLLSNHYVFRERSTGARRREVTLKFRHPDRYVAGGRNMHPGDLKFEQDVKTPFRCLYSFSSKQRVSSAKIINRLSHPAELFPDLPRQLPRYDADEPLRLVNDFTALETVFAGVKFELEPSPRTVAECAIIVWHRENLTHKSPAVVEFSFRYDAPRGGYTRKSAENAYAVFMAVQKNLTGWIDTDAPSKTAYVYGMAQGHRRRVADEWSL